MGKTSYEVKYRWEKKNYKQFQCRLKPPLWEEIQAYIDAEGISKAQFLERAIQKLTE